MPGQPLLIGTALNEPFLAHVMGISVCIHSDWFSRAGAMKGFAEVLHAQHACPCTALNELSSNVLEALACITPALPAPQLLTDPVQALSAALCEVLEDCDSPLRLRASAAAAAGGLATAQGAAESLGAGTTVVFFIDDWVEPVWD